jgi:hypothetical protein
MSSYNIIRQRVVTICPASRALEIIFAWILRVEVDIDKWTPYLSVAILGWLSLSNTRQLCQSLVKVFRWLSTPGSSDAFILFFSEVVGMYFAASVLLLRVQLPEEHRVGLERMVGDVNAKMFKSFHLHFDFWFVISGLSTLGLSFFERWFVDTKHKVV